MKDNELDTILLEDGLLQDFKVKTNIYHSIEVGKGWDKKQILLIPPFFAEASQGARSEDQFPSQAKLKTWQSFSLVSPNLKLRLIVVLVAE